MTTSFRIDYGVPANDRLPREGKPWTEAEDMELLAKASAYGIGGVAERMGRSASAGYKRYLKLRSVHFTKGE